MGEDKGIRKLISSQGNFHFRENYTPDLRHCGNGQSEQRTTARAGKLLIEIGD
jgi:hypothetical protein